MVSLRPRRVATRLLRRGQVRCDGAMKRALLLVACLTFLPIAGVSDDTESFSDGDVSSERAVSPVFDSYQDCRAVALRQGALCSSSECRGALLRLPAYCRTGDCRAFAYGAYSYCDTQDCRAVLLNSAGLCQSANCRAAVFRSPGLCRF